MAPTKKPSRQTLWRRKKEKRNLYNRKKSVSCSCLFHERQRARSLGVASDPLASHNFLEFNDTQAHQQASIFRFDTFLNCAESCVVNPGTSVNQVQVLGDETTVEQGQRQQIQEANHDQQIVDEQLISFPNSNVQCKEQFLDEDGACIKEKFATTVNSHQKIDKFYNESDAKTDTSKVSYIGYDAKPNFSDTEIQKDNLSDVSLSDVECSFEVACLQPQPHDNQVIAYEEDSDNTSEEEPVDGAFDLGSEEHSINENFSDDDFDDPDDPHYPSDHSASESSDSQSSDSDEETFCLNLNGLNMPLRFHQRHTAKEDFLLKLATSLRYNLCYEALISSFVSQNIVYGKKYLPTSKKALWRHLNRSNAGIVEYCVCNRCGRGLGKKTDYDGNNVQCGNCGFDAPKTKMKTFVIISVRKQLEKLLGTPGMLALLQWRETRAKLNETSVEDVYDGLSYKRLQEPGEPLSQPYNYSYTMNTDGFKTGKKARTSAWPLYLRINELPPNLRQKHRILAGLWLDTSDPDMTVFLQPFVSQLNRFSNEGVLWKPDGVNEVRSLFIPTCMCVDSKARFPVLNMTQYNGRFGCTFCEHEGVMVGNPAQAKYPITLEENEDPPTLRTDERLRAQMILAANTGIRQIGVVGPSPLMNLQYFDLAVGNAMDDLHPIFLRVVAFLTDLLIALPGINDMSCEEKLRRIDDRLLQIKTPSCISRKPTSIKRRKSWNGTEWRNWLLYYSLPCLQELIPQRHLNLLGFIVHATFLLSQDVLSPEEIDVAEDHFTSFVTLFENYFGVVSMRYSVHLMLHVAESVRNWGPLWVYSTFNFESWNMKLRRLITSPQGAIDQIITRHLINTQVILAMYDMGLSETIRMQISSIMTKSQRTFGFQCGKAFLIGKRVQRPPTADERQLLNRENLDCNILSVYKKVLLGCTVFACDGAALPDGRSRDSLLYSWDDTFCTIRAIVVFRDNDDQDCCGMFVTEHAVNHAFPNAPHVGRVLINGDLSHFIQISKVRGPAVKVESLGDVFVIPVPNQCEID